MNEYTVQIILSELTIIAESRERTEEIATDIYEADARTHFFMDYVLKALK